MKRLVTTFSALFLFASTAFAGGPLLVTGPIFGAEGVPLTWDPAAMPIKYRVDGGPLSSKVANAAALTRVDAMFNTWSSVSTATLQYQNAGAIQSVGSFSGGDVNTLDEFSDVRGSCRLGTQSPVVFDADGSLLEALNVDSDFLIGLTSICSFNGAHIRSALIVLNGKFQDGIDTTTNFELTAAEFDEAITHEIGHLSGLDHSQISSSIVLYASGNCSVDDLAGLPLMFPFSSCQSKASVGLPMLAPDDIAWISYLYPNGSFSSTYGFISGQVRFEDGITPVQGVNVIARRPDDPSTSQDESRRVAISVVSGFLFTDRPGQIVTGDNSEGSTFGSRQPGHEGYFLIPLPSGEWTVSLESIDQSFTDSSSVGPLNPPVPMPGFGSSKTVTVTPGATTNLDFKLFGTPPRFDSFEDESRLRMPVELGPHCFLGVA